MQAWRTIHEPKRGVPFFRPKVHSGFDKAWRRNRFDLRIMKRLEEIYKANEVNPDDVRFLITGNPLVTVVVSLTKIR